jgi:sec-independent protein translocase protein TatA
MSGRPDRRPGKEDKVFEGLLQPMHLVVILLIALVVFGPRKLPELGKGLGQAIRGFKESLSGKDEAKPEEKDDREKPGPSGQSGP